MLREVRWPPAELFPADRFFLVIEHDGAMYMGCLLFDDPAFCLQMYHLLPDYSGSSLEYIGGVDIGYTL